MKTCPNCGELVGDKVKSCFNCKYNFLYGRYIPEGEELTQHDVAHAIFEIFNCDEKPEYYEIVNRFDMDNIDGAIELIQDCFDCDKKTARESLELYEKSVDELVRKRGGQG